MNTKIPISVTMLTKNSSKYLQEVLMSYADFDEIILLDNGSTDNTLEIASKFENVQIKESPFIGFGPLKNLASSYAKHNWILNMDSDEVMTDDLLNKIKSIDLKDINAIYGFICLNHYRKRVIKACGWYPNIVKRLYNKQIVAFNNKQVHEALVYDEKKIKCIIFQEFYLHYSFDGAQDLINKMQLYTSLYAENNKYNKQSSVLKAVMHGTYSFFKNYFLQKGCFYGGDGLVISAANAQGSYYKYIKLKEANERLTCSLIITTYNRPDALEAVLASILQQKRLPQEVIIADDGSSEETKKLITHFQGIYPIPLIHAWQEDKGFRAALSRNNAISKCSGEYIIMIDGDMVLHPHFIADHIKNAKRGFFIQGGRVMFSPTKTESFLTEKEQHRIKWYHKGIETRLEKRFSAIRIPSLSKLFSKNISYSHKAIRSCNLAVFKEDVIKVNGFNNKFVGWGREDSEFVERLFNSGIKRRNIKFAAIAYHLYHKEEPRASLKENDILLQKAINEKLSYCDDGLNKFLAN